ncbi:MAG: transposase [Parcubacteria group bacterium]
MRYTKNEKEEEIAKDLRKLKRSGVNIISVTADGRKAIKKAVLSVFSNVIYQRCLVHIQRYAEIYLTQNPKTEAGRELKQIVKLLNNINNHLAKRTWLARLNEWQRKYHYFLKEKTYHEEAKRWWYTHRNIRRVIYHINQALPDMFNYLDYPDTPKDTNRLEGRFTDLKHKLRDHRGLKKTKRENYFNWYLHYKNQEEKERKTNRYEY